MNPTPLQASSPSTLRRGPDRRQWLRHALGGLTATALCGAVGARAAAPALPEVEVFRSASCGCCGAWVDHLRQAGFPVKETLVGDTTAARQRLGMPDRFGSCHTATVAGYVLEGHVPAPEVRRLLALRPRALGLAVPGMPPSAPGMDVPGRHDPYEVLLVERSGAAQVFARHPVAAKG